MKKFFLSLGGITLLVFLLFIFNSCTIENDNNSKNSFGSYNDTNTENEQNKNQSHTKTINSSNGTLSEKKDNIDIKNSQKDDTNKSPIIGLSYPPVSSEKQLNITLQNLKDLKINHVRIGTDWKNREKTKGNYYWKPLDQKINTLKKNNVSILLTIPNSGPSWVCETQSNQYCTYNDINDFETYIEKLLERYSNKIDKIQFGNEWDLKFKGDINNYILYNNIIYDKTKELSPNTQVVLGGLTRGIMIYQHVCINKNNLDYSQLDIIKNGTSKDLNTYFKQKICIKNKTKYKHVLENTLKVIKEAKYDILDLHLYDDAENWFTYFNILKNISDKPIIVSEFGGPHPEFENYSDNYQAQRIKVYIETIKSLDIKEAYYFKLFDSPSSYHSQSGLIGVNQKKKKSYEVFKNEIKK